MSKYSRLDVIDRFSTGYIKDGKINENATEAKLKAFDKQRIGTELYREGMSWFKNNDLADATELYEIDGQMKQKKDIIHLQRGYQQATKQEGFNCGYKGIALETLPEKYTNDKYFLEGYKNGIETAQKDKKRNNKAK